MTAPSQEKSTEKCTEEHFVAGMVNLVKEFPGVCKETLP